MKILVIYQRSGAGISIFYKRLICELAQRATVDVLTDCEDIERYEGCGIRNLYTQPFTPKMKEWDRKFIKRVGRFLMSEWWAYKLRNTIGNDYDVVLSCIASTQLMPCASGSYIAKRLKCKHAIYAVDAIPGPGGWTPPKIYKWRLKAVRRYFPQADYVAASNKHMLDFQLTTFKHKPTLLYNVLLTPSPDTTYEYPISQENIFLYTGTLYGLRNSDYLLNAFKRILQVHTDAQLIFAGKVLELKDIDNIFTADERKHITILPHTNDLGSLFARAKVLIDIDADLDKDPFLSSKIVTYIKVNRMIVCETGHDTPSREMFAHLNTVIQCDHNTDSLYNGMMQALDMAGKEQDYSERKSLIKEFSTERVGSILWNDLLKVCNKTE